MSTESSFTDLIDRVRHGDADAAAELVQEYEPTIRRWLRVHLDARLRRVSDTMDLTQAVLCSFFVRAASGQYELDTPDQLLKLLTTMARHKLSKARRDQFRARRDTRRVVDTSAEEHNVAAAASSPSVQVAAKEMLAEVHRRLSDQERQLVDLRNDGRDWAAIAAEVGGSPDALRKQLARAVARVADELGLDDADDE
jgi:RNA polymerase sigma factor (sigma-70 family)